MLTLYGASVRAEEPFGTMLRRLRTGAGFCQERLAERAGISANGVAALEAGRRKNPRLSTVALLGDALGLDPDQRSDLIAAATRTSSPATDLPPAPVTSHVGDAAQGTRSTILSDHTFVGRRDELEALHLAWNTRTKVVLLSGEAGVGKSTLAEEFAAELASQGVTGLRGRSTPEQLGVYEAFLGPVRGALGRYDGNVPTGLRDLGRLVPGLFESGGDALVPIRSDPAVERRLLFETVSALFVSTGPTLLLLDDLHWADPGTLALLAFISAQPELSELMIIGTVRSTDVTTATNAALAELRQSQRLRRITGAGYFDAINEDPHENFARSIIVTAMSHRVDQRLAQGGHRILVEPQVVQSHHPARMKRVVIHELQRPIQGVG